MKKRDVLDGVVYGYRASNKVHVRPQVVVRDLATGVIKKIIPARKYKIKEKHVQLVEPVKARDVVSRQVFGSEGGVVARSTDKKFFGKKY